MSLLSYNSCYIRVKRLFSLLYNHVQQHILNTHSLLVMVDQNINNVALLPNNGSISISIFHYYLLNCKIMQNYMVILPEIYAALFWSEN